MKRIFSVMLCLNIFLINLPVCRALGVSAYSAVLIEKESGRVLFAKNADQKLSMASTTKIMTALCAVESGNLDKKYQIHAKAVGVEGSSIYLKNGEHLTLRELVYGLMLSSGNDAAVAIAYAVSGSVEDFAGLMNKTAEKIGVKNSHFMNPNGLDEEGHYTTASDLAKISAYAMKNEEFKEIVSTYEKTIPHEGQTYNRHLRNHNKLLKMYDGCIGIKTGFTKKSGRCLVSAAEKNGVTLIAVTLKAPDDWNDHTNMLNYGFKKVKTKAVIKKDEYLKTASVKGGMKKEVRLLAKKEVNIPVIEGESDKITLKYKVKNSLAAPVGYRQSAGKVEVYLNGNFIAETECVTESVIKKDDRKTFKRSLGLVIMSFIQKRLHI